MRTITLSAVGVTSLLAIVLVGTAAQAIPRTFVSAVGIDTNPCTRASPCRTLQGAHDQTDSGGEINCLDAGNFGNPTITITKSITIDCGATANTTFVNVARGFFINTPGVVVRLRNLTLYAIYAGFSDGIRFENGTALFVENCVITNFTAGISFVAQTGVSAKLFVVDSVIKNNSTGIFIGHVASASALAVIERTRVGNNGDGIFANSTSTGQSVVQFRNSLAANNLFDGIRVVGSSGGTGSVTVDRSSLVLNGTGFEANGPQAFALLGRSTVSSNFTGLKITGGGNIFSYQNNQIGGNVADGAPTAVLTVK